MYVFIDTANRADKSLALIKGNAVFYLRILPDTWNKKGDVLFQIDALLKKYHTSAHKLLGIIVVTGPGQFSSLRTGIAFANTFGFALKIPVVGILKEQGAIMDELIQRGVALLRFQKRFHQVAPQYGKEPNITQPKAKI